ncbi:50S ribosomal protein L3 [bacterium Unc6]|nr:50S ribosomal protein L3 [bacterium Unc6]
MSIGLLGRKLGMTQIFAEDGRRIPVTVIEAGPCPVLQIKTAQKNGYDAILIGFGEKKESRVSKPNLGFFKKIGRIPVQLMKEIKIPQGTEKPQEGVVLRVDQFKPGDFVDVTGKSIGKGFQGGMKRWGWAGGPSTHGSTSHRRVGSIGSSTTPGRVIRGHHMPGHMGNDTVTTQSLEVIKVDVENNLIAIKGSIPGSKSGYVTLCKALKRLPILKVATVAEKHKKADTLKASKLMKRIKK